MPLNTYPGRNRTAYDSGVRLDGIMFAGVPITGTGVSPAQAAALAAPLAAFLQQIPYDLDSEGRLAYTASIGTLNHLAELKYAPDHPDPAKQGQPVMADLLGGDYITKYGGAPMPFIDLDRIEPQALESLLIILYGLLGQMTTAS